MKYKEKQDKSLFKPGPLHEYRFEILEQMKKVSIKTGDIVFRLDSYLYLGFIPFSRLVAKITKSDYDHSAIFYVENDELLVVEINDAGTTLMRIEDWVDLSAVNYFSIFRVKNNSDASISRIRQEIKSFLAADPDYDFSYGSAIGKYYCTEAICRIMEKAGFDLMEPISLKKIMNPFGYWIFFIINWIVLRLTGKGFSNKPMYFVGNENVGIAASPLLEKIVDIKY